MRHDYDTDGIDVGTEISGLKIEIEDARRNMKWAGYIGIILVVLLLLFGGYYFTRTEMLLAVAIVAAVAGIKEHLFRNRIKQARDQLVNLELWAQAEHQNSKRVMRIVRSMDDFPNIQKAG